ncbi:ABC transporter permease [Shewanella colwelliana]|uniref:ABC transporter permease n=1 Tax=Shewanella colwelliana TaxID=23 RepID=A0A1E5IX53_SHECO|nr:ABC transporter permease [Shewanella colwelliana]MCZ4338538.1 ABC transporter permease [Shewanella colwelliana]MDX1281682.1 FtsX-like permease family protein [Shewanella colwelliana]OEG75135.1 ABC transporter permease [Shewanella colwelliana]GIU37557.1 ABC transporter permease [Shewanella colwelliana]
MVIKLAWRNLWRNKIRTSTMVCAMVFGLMGVVAMMGFMSGMYGNMIDNAIAWQTSHIQIQSQRYLDDPDINETLINPQPLIEALQRMPQVKAFSTRFLVDGMIASARANRGIRINGIDSLHEAEVTPIVGSITQGSWLPQTGRHPIVVSQKTAERLRLKLGSKVVLTFSNADKDVTGAAFRVAGIFNSPSSSFDEANSYVRRSDLSKLAGVKGIHEIAIVLNESNNMDNHVAKQLAGQLSLLSDSGNRVRDWQQVQPMLATIISQMGASNAVILIIFVSAMGFGIVNVMLMSVFERTRELGMLMAIGMVKGKVFSLIIMESTLLGVTGATIGLLASLMLVTLLGHTGIPLGSMAQGLGAFGVDTTLYPTVSANEYVAVFVTVVLVSILASLYPARQILKQRPVDAMSHKH